jgi:DNA-binding NarL/FixJ family response regulator
MGFMRKRIGGCVARFLVVDDSPTVRLTLATALRNAQKGAVDVVEAADGEAAMREFEKRAPDATFLDLMLPKTPGLEVLRKMLELRPEAKVVIITGLPAGDEQVVQAIAAGAFGFIPKPARTETVRKLLNEIETESGRFGRIR